MSNQIFSKIDGAIATLIGYIETGDLVLPDLQRPSVWGNNKVRDLSDSVARGQLEASAIRYGYILENHNNKTCQTIVYFTNIDYFCEI